jgi:hypothetical protein
MIMKGEHGKTQWPASVTGKGNYFVPPSKQVNEVSNHNTGSAAQSSKRAGAPKSVGNVKEVSNQARVSACNTSKYR